MLKKSFSKIFFSKKNFEKLAMKSDILKKKNLININVYGLIQIIKFPIQPRLLPARAIHKSLKYL